MRTSRITLAVLAAFALAAANAQEATAPRLLVVGPIESVDPATRTVMVLGQRILLSNVGSLNVGNTLAVYGFSRTDGSIQGSVARDQGAYVAGATPIFLAGTVQSADALTGHVIVNGVKVDLTPAMVSGQVSPAIGSKLAVQGIQPVSRGVVVTDGIIGSGAATNGIIGSGASASGIIGSGAAANGIIGSGYRSTNGIIGSGASANGIIGSGAAANGIIGSGYRSTNGIIGSGAATNGIIRRSR
ncbi:MAG TPA: hypothetical protein VMG33_14985 [Steroidobacteraceae bacterium]|nr:hypothetical protein [Steroidobacteraceae bacterium]